MDFEIFQKTYVYTNIPEGSPTYNQDLLDKLRQDLSKHDGGNVPCIAVELLVAISCGLKRSDLTAGLFQNLVESEKDQTNDDVMEHFYRIREVINIIWPFVGLPQVIPACLAVVGYLRSRGITVTQKENRQRPDISHQHTLLGTKTRLEIYKASANSEVFTMLKDCMGDLAYALDSVVFGYNIGHAGQGLFSLAETELILTAAIISLGATRQAGSHAKACIAFGYSESTMSAVQDVILKLADWQRVKISPLDISSLAHMARKTLKGK